MKADLNTILLTVVTLVTALTPIILAMINKKQGTMLVNSEIAKTAAVETAVKVESVRVQAVQAAVKVDEVAKVAEATSVTVAARMEEIAKVGLETQKTGNDVHTLVNSNMGVQLKLAAGFARRLADITKSKEDEAAADLAELAHAEHVKKQAVVDSGAKRGGLNE